MYLKSWKFLIVVILIFAFHPLWSAYLTNMPVELTQPNGAKISCLASGDEFHNWLHDKDYYTIIQSQVNGYYTYATKQGDQVTASNLIVGIDDPQRNGLVPHINISEAEYRRRRETRFQMPEQRNAPTTGTINNIVIYIRFSGETEFGESISTYDGWFNTNTSSQKNYFLEASYNQLTVNTTFYPAPASGYVVSYQDSYIRSYYQPYNATTNPNGYQGDTQMRNRLFTLLVNATNAVSSQIPSDLIIDADNDGNVDNVVYIIRGQSDGWADLLWPHRWAIYDRTVRINGKRVYDYNLQLQDFLAAYNVGVICHEFFHTLGAPDLYHYTSNGISPVGSWDLMESNTNPPQHMGAYMKWKYGGWISSIPLISANGTYNLNPLTSPTGNAYRINSPNSSTEYFVVEYRRKTGTFENQIPGSGLLVYRINTSAGNGNASGPPDEVYIYRPGGTTTVNGTIINAHYSSQVGRTAINSTTNPTPFLSNGSAGGLYLHSIGSAGATISFANGEPSAGDPTCVITAPTEGAMYNVGQVVTVNVNATDPAPGSIARVDFYLDGSTTPAFTDYSAPYSWAWNTTSATQGMRTITATAVDNQNNTASHSVSIFLLGVPDEGFESGNFTSYPWVNNSTAPWTIQSSDKFTGTYAAKSGAISHNQLTELSVALETTSAGVISFYNKVSSETDFDYMKFYINGNLQDSWSGVLPWSFQSYAVSAGNNTFKWEYAKDVSVNSGSDCAWLDHITFPPHATTAPPTIVWNPSLFEQELNINSTDFQTLTIGNSGDMSLSYTASTPSNVSTVLDESFETGSIPAGWSQINETGSTNWVFNASGGNNNSNPSGAFDGQYNARLYYNSATDNRVTKLVTPSLNLGNMSNASLSFWHAQVVWSGDQDELRIYYKTTAGGAWNLLATYTDNVASWTQREIDLPNPSATYYIAFEGTTKYGYGVCVDKVVVTAEAGAVSPWLSLNGTTQVSGNIAVGGPNHNISVGFDSSGLNPGTYNSTISITSNSSTNSSISIPVTLTVPEPTPEINVSLSSMAFGTVLIGTTQSRSFLISNAGTATLSGTITTPAGHSVQLSRTESVERQELPEIGSRNNSETRNTLEYSVPAGGSVSFTITFAPVAVQTYNGLCVITHNAGGGNKNILITGQGGKPTLGLNPDSFEAYLFPGQTESQTLSISNTGNVALNYSLSISGDASWLTVNGETTISNTITPGGSAQNVTVSFDAANLGLGVYEAYIIASTNDPANSTVYIDVSLEVLNPIYIHVPTGGETWESNSVQLIEFNYTGAASDVMFHYSIDGGLTWLGGSTEPVVEGNNVIEWTVPGTPSTNCVIGITDGVAPYLHEISNVFSIEDPTPPTTPQNLSIVYNEVDGTVTLSWSASEGSPTAYRIYFCPEPDFATGVVLLDTISSSNTSYTVSSPHSEDKGFFRIDAIRTTISK